MQVGYKQRQKEEEQLLSCVENYYQMKWTGVYSDGKFCLVDAMCITHLENMPITMVTLPDKKVDRKQYDSADRSRMLSQTSSEFGEKSLSVHDCHSQLNSKKPSIKMQLIEMELEHAESKNLKTIRKRLLSNNGQRMLSFNNVNRQKQYEQQQLKEKEKSILSRARYDETIQKGGQGDDKHARIKGMNSQEKVKHNQLKSKDFQYSIKTNQGKNKCQIQKAVIRIRPCCAKQTHVPQKQPVSKQKQLRNRRTLVNTLPQFKNNTNVRIGMSRQNEQSTPKLVDERVLQGVLDNYDTIQGMLKKEECMLLPQYNDIIIVQTPSKEDQQNNQSNEEGQGTQNVLNQQAQPAQKQQAKRRKSGGYSGDKQSAIRRLNIQIQALKQKMQQISHNKHHLNHKPTLQLDHVDPPIKIQKQPQTDIHTQRSVKLQLKSSLINHQIMMSIPYQSINKTMSEDKSKTYSLGQQHPSKKPNNNRIEVQKGKNLVSVGAKPKNEAVQIIEVYPSGKPESKRIIKLIKHGVDQNMIDAFNHTFLGKIIRNHPRQEFLRDKPSLELLHQQPEKQSLRQLQRVEKEEKLDRIDGISSIAPIEIEKQHLPAIQHPSAIQHQTKSVSESEEGLMPMALPKTSRQVSPRFIYQKSQYLRSTSREASENSTNAKKMNLIDKIENSDQKFSQFIRKEAQRHQAYKYRYNPSAPKDEVTKTSDVENNNVTVTGNSLALKGVELRKNDEMINQQQQELLDGLPFVTMQLYTNKSPGQVELKEKESQSGIIPLSTPKEIDTLSFENGGKNIFDLDIHNKQHEESEQDNLPQRPRIQLQRMEMPIVPNPPKITTTLDEMIELVRQLAKIFQFKDNITDLEKLVLKRYKNCIMFTLPTNNALKVVWHFSGKLYIGEWDDEKGGKSGEGIEYIHQKQCYRGQFKAGKKHGIGVLILPNGNLYQGEWIDGEKEGQGKSFDKQKNVFYEGGWKKGREEGSGKLVSSKKEFYIGTFSKGIRHGQGTDVFANGDAYRGEYVYGRFHGKGYYKWANGSYYKGEFLEGYRSGQGKWKSCKATGESYQGSYLNDKKHGQGKYSWANGCVYSGQFQNDLKHGNGQVLYPEGREMRAIWSNGHLMKVLNRIQQTNRQSPLQSHRSNPVSIIHVVDQHSARARNNLL